MILSCWIKCCVPVDVWSFVEWKFIVVIEVEFREGFFEVDDEIFVLVAPGF